MSYHRSLGQIAPVLKAPAVAPRASEALAMHDSLVASFMSGAAVHRDVTAMVQLFGAAVDELVRGNAAPFSAMLVRIASSPDASDGAIVIAAMIEAARRGKRWSGSSVAAIAPSTTVLTQTPPAISTSIIKAPVAPPTLRLLGFGQTPVLTSLTVPAASSREREVLALRDQLVASFMSDAAVHRDVSALVPLFAAAVDGLASKNVQPLGRALVQIAPSVDVGDALVTLSAMIEAARRGKRWSGGAIAVMTPSSPTVTLTKQPVPTVVPSPPTTLPTNIAPVPMPTGPAPTGPRYEPAPEQVVPDVLAPVDEAPDEASFLPPDEMLFDEPSFDTTSALPALPPIQFPAVPTPGSEITASASVTGPKWIIIGGVAVAALAGAWFVFGRRPVTPNRRRRRART